ncbi:MAG: hypothetical protein ACE5HK_05275 [Candidatus Methylomirabilales bacterium]
MREARLHLSSSKAWASPSPHCRPGPICFLKTLAWWKVRVGETDRNERTWVLEAIREAVPLYAEMMIQATTEGQAGRIGGGSQRLSLTTMTHSESDDIS